jgi:putative CocE/NonD family hydrolase
MPSSMSTREVLLVHKETLGIPPVPIADAASDRVRFWGSSEGRDGYDTVEHLAQLPWCNGRVAIAGNSWLAISQWFIAAEKPPHLACILPLEGASDMYREQHCRGGVPNVAFSSLVTDILSGK